MYICISIIPVNKNSLYTFEWFQVFLSNTNNFYRCTTWTLAKRMEKKLDSNYTRMLRAILNKSWRQHSTKQQLYGHLPPITKTIKIRRTRHAGNCWRSWGEFMSDVLLWTLSHGRAMARRPVRTYTQQLCSDMGCSPGYLLKAMGDREVWRERVRDIRADSATWWWWWRIMLILMDISDPLIWKEHIFIIRHLSSFMLQWLNIHIYGLK